MIELPLDHNFPEPILDAVTPWMEGTSLIPIRKIDDRLTRLTDRQLVIALHQMGYRGLVTNNYRMLQNPIRASSDPQDEATDIRASGCRSRSRESHRRSPLGPTLGHQRDGIRELSSHLAASS